MADEKLGLMERLQKGNVLCAEGYIFELERRGYLKAGAFVPEVSIEFPEVVEELHREFARAGTEVQVALTYYANREKLKAVGRENDLEKINRAALKIAKKVADEDGALVAGNICNTSAYDPNDEASAEEVRRQFTEQTSWAADEGVDFILAETFDFYGEALIALEVIKEHNLPAVINLTSHAADKTKDGVDYIEACQRLEAAGADVVGFNCTRGPEAMMPLLKKLRAAVKIPIAALPVPYRTTLEEPSFQSLKNPDGSSAYTLGLESHLCNRMEMAKFASDVKELGVEFIGICCGAGPHHVRAMAEALGRTVPASKFSPDMTMHYQFGNKDFAKEQEQGHLEHSDARFE